MNARRVLLTGFGAFEEVTENPSGALARDLDGATLAGGSLVGAVLPVSFERAPRELDELVQLIRPDAIVATGVHPGSGFRIERGAGVELAGGRPDVDGVDATLLARPGAARLETDLDVAGLAAVLERASETAVELSEDAGGYVCECVYRRVLEIGEERGSRGLFVHLPPLDELALEGQRAGLRALLAGVFEQLTARD